jgi:hypothetical protein
VSTNVPARGASVCIDDKRTSTEVVVRMGSERVLLRTDTSTTTGEPDYPSEPFHQMTRDAAVAFADRLAR